MFWSLILEPGKRYSSTVKESFHLSMATLDVKSCKNDSEIHPVSIKVEGEELLLCNLSKSTSPHASLDLMFQKGNEITFFTNGKANVHLTGYCLQEDIIDDEDDYDSSEEEEEESNDTIGLRSALSELADKSKNKDKQKANKRKLESIEAVSKKKHKGGKSESDDDDDDDDDDSDDLSGDLDDSKLDQLVDSINAEDDSSDENDEDDSDIDDEEDENSDDSEGEDEVDDEDEDDEDSSDSEEERGQKQKKKQEVKTPVSNKQKTPASNKKQEKQNKHELTNGTTPQSNKKGKNKNQANQQTPKQAALKTPNKDGQKTPKKGESTPQSQKKTLSGGVVVEELKPGSGQPAKYGKVVQVYYTGRLKNNNRVFDQSTQGPGFKFRLGNNEVIKGWDLALNGMKVGGKRRITIPPAMAYGSKGSPPQIPPNSWLVFDVELKSVN